MLRVYIHKHNGISLMSSKYYNNIIISYMNNNNKKKKNEYLFFENIHHFIHMYLYPVLRRTCMYLCIL